MEMYPDYSNDAKKTDIKSIFFGQSEMDFINAINSEFLQSINGQSVQYVKIDREKTQVNTYGEARKKIIEGDPITLPARVKEQVEMINDDFTIRYDRKLRVAFWQSLNVLYGVDDIIMGNFVKWQQKTYEIINVDRNKRFFGQERFVYEIIATCVVRE